MTSSSRSGILLVDKPGGITSHDAVAATRRLAGTRKVGHAGTLDPMATGLLVLGLNSSTRLLTFVVGLDKEYLATIRLGRSTTTDDAEGETVADVDATNIDRSAIDAGIRALTGAISQVPSSVSAIKVDGRRAYDLVRAGETVELKPRSVTVSTFEVLDARTEGPFLDLDVRVECSSGTYIRALARDLGTTLGVGGHLTALRRTRIGPFLVRDAATIADLDPQAQLRLPADVATALFPRHDLSHQDVIDLQHGKRIAAPGLTAIDASEPPAGTRTSGPIAAIAPDGRLVGLVERTPTGAKTIVNFPTDEVQQ